jgi:hypothetical protein
MARFRAGPGRLTAIRPAGENFVTVHSLLAPAGMPG